MKNFVSILALALMMGACQNSNQTNAAAADEAAIADSTAKTTLVAYFSASEAHITAQVAKTLALDTNYATMISAPQLRKNKLKFIQISKVDDEHLLATIVIEGNVIKFKGVDMLNGTPVLDIKDIL